MKWTKYLIAAGVAATLTGCNTSLEKLQNAQPVGSDFSVALSQQYLEMAQRENSASDWLDAGYFAKKGLLAAEGSTPHPELIENWYVPSDRMAEMEGGRERLMNALRGSAKATNPQLAAGVQARFDCWIEEQDENWQHDHISQCEQEFWALLPQLEDGVLPAAKAGLDILDGSAKPDVPVAFVVYFDFNKSSLTQEAKEGIEQVVSHMKDTGTQHLHLAGHADTVGSKEYNERLSERRALTVKEAFTKLGVPLRNVQIEYFGESSLREDTKDNVKNKKNRRVEIRILN